MNHDSEVNLASRSNKSEEKSPLTILRKSSSHNSKWAPYGINFNVIIGSLAAVTFGITIAVIVECIYGSREQIKVSGAVVTDSKQCGEIGIEILKARGTSVDAAVAVVFCLGVTMPHLTGLGGGGFLTIRKGGYSAINVAINFMDFIPQYDSVHDFKEALGIPGVLKGLWIAHKKFGSLPWSQLIQPSITLASEGFVVEPSLSKQLKSGYIADLDVFMINGSLAKEGDIVKWPALANTLTLISQDGEYAFYNGSILDQLLPEMSKMGFTNLTRKDFNEYLPQISTPVEIVFNGYNVLTAPFNSGGPLVKLAIQLLNYLDTTEKLNETKIKYNLTTIANVIEVELERSESLRKELSLGSVSDETKKYLASLVVGDPPQVSVHNPVAAIALASDSQDLHIAVVTSLGAYFGANKYVPSAGIILSDPSVWQFYQGIKMTSLILIKHNHFCQPAIVAASNDFKNVVVNLPGWLSSIVTNQSLSSDSDIYDNFVASITRSNNNFRTTVDPEDRGFAEYI